MALHPNFPDDPHAILDQAIRWFPADEALRTSSFEKLLPPLVPALRKVVKDRVGLSAGGGHFAKRRGASRPARSGKPG